ncbi:MAG: PaaI family thioesterase [Dehalococcoidia bacterium]
MADRALRARLDAAIDLLDDAQCQRLLDWAGAMNRTVENARAPGTSPGPIAEMLHIANETIDGGRATYSLDIRPDLLNPHGLLHGGAVYTMIDYSMGAATMSVLAPDEVCATIEIKVSYLEAARAGRLQCDTRVVKQGRRVVFLESRIIDDQARLVATATGSFAVIRSGS